MKHPVDIINQNMDTLKSIAQSNNMLTADGIAQRFGVISSVVIAKSGLSLGSEMNDSEFKISGSAELLQTLIGKGKSKAGYYQSDIRGQIASFIWTDNPETESQGVAIAYTFISLNGESVITNWICPISFFNIRLSNHGSYFYKSNLKL